MILAGWQWIFYLVTIITLPGALLAAFLIPAPSQLEHAAAAADVEEKAASAQNKARTAAANKGRGARGGD